MESTAFVLRSALALVFLAAAAGKATNMGSFTRTLQALSVSGSIQKPVGWALIFAEAATSLWLLTGFALPAALALSALLVMLFTGVSPWARARKQEIPCSCFGRSQTVLGTATLVRSLLLATLVVALGLISLFADATWWPREPETLALLATLSIALLVLDRWLMAAPLIWRLVKARSAGVG